MRIERLFAGGDLPRQGPGVFDTTSTASGALEAHRRTRDAQLRQFAAIIRGQDTIHDARHDRSAADGRFGQSLQAAAQALVARLEQKSRQADTVTRAATIQATLADGFDRVIGAIKAGKTAPDGQVPAFPAVMEEMAGLRDAALDSLPDAAARGELEPKLDAVTRRFGPQVLQATTAQRVDGQRRAAEASLAALARRAAGTSDPLDRWQQLMDGFSLVDALGDAGVYDTAAAETKKLAFRVTLARGAMRADIAADPTRVLAGLDDGAYDLLIPEENREPWREAARAEQVARETKAAQDQRLRRARLATDLARSVEAGDAGLPEVEAADLAPADRDRLRARAERAAVLRNEAAHGIDRIEERLGRGEAVDLTDAGTARALEAHFQAVAQPWVDKPDADSPAKLAAYAERLGAVPNALSGAVLDSLQAGAPDQALLAAETLDRVTAAVPGSLAQFPDGAAARAHLLVALTEAGLAPADALARAAEQSSPDAATRDSRQAEGEAAAIAPRTRSFLARAWAEAADDADALPAPGEERFATLFTDAYTAIGDERTARTLAFKRLLGEIGEGKGKEWVGEDSAEPETQTGSDDADTLWGGPGLVDAELRELAQSVFGAVRGAPNGADAALPAIIPAIVQLVRTAGPVVAKRALRYIARLRKSDKELPEPKKPDGPDVPQPPRSGEKRPASKPQPEEPSPASSSPQPGPLRPTGIAELAREEVEREREKEKQEKVSESRFSDKDEELIGSLNGKKYVRTRGGSYDLGFINDDAASAMGMPAAPVHLPEGFHSEKTGSGFGYQHLSLRQSRRNSILDHGYPSIPDFVADVAENYTEVWAGRNGRFLLVKPNGNAKTLVVELEKNGEGYDVVTGGIFGKKYVSRSGKILWRKSE